MNSLPSAFSDLFRLYFGDHNLRRLIHRPFKKGLRAFFYILAITVVLSYLSCQIGIGYLDNTSIVALIFGNILALIFLPPILAFIYFSLFCDDEYGQIAKYSLYEIHGYEQLRLESKVDSSFLKSFGWIIVLSILFLISMIMSLFLPVIGIFLAGLLFVYEFSRYSFNELKLGFAGGISQLLGNIFGLLVLSGLFGVICLIPFLILFVYPFGVLICSIYFGSRKET